MKDRQTALAIAAGTVGHSLEWYDFAVYAFLSSQIAANFFPSDNSTTSLLAALATFGVGFVARPIGGVLFGRLADRRGRRGALVISFLMMAVATVALGLLPTYDTIGILAPILLVAARLVQGFAAGGEIAGAIVFLVEWGGNDRRGLAGSFHQVGSGVGFLLGSFVVAILTTALPGETMSSLGWRIPFLIGGVIGPMGYFLRRIVDETPVFTQAIAEPVAKSVPPTSTELLKLSLRAFLFNAFWSIAFYFFLSYLPTFAQRTLQVSSGAAFWISSLTLAIYVCLLPAFGWLSDRIGRKPLILASCAGYALLLYPIFSALTAQIPVPPLTFALVSLLFVVFLALFAAPAPAMISEIFPASHRGTYMALGFSMGSVIFGGFTPFIALWLTSYFATPMAPIVYVSTASILSAAYIVGLRETFKDRFL